MKTKTNKKTKVNKQNSQKPKHQKIKQKKGPKPNQYYLLFI